MSILHRLIILLILVGNLSAGICNPKEFEVIRQRVTESLLESKVNDESVEKLIRSINPNGMWSGIDYTDVRREAFQHSRHTANMALLARAYSTLSSKYYQNKEVENVIVVALEHWLDNDYISENWWNNQIGTPSDMINLMLLVGDKLSKELVDRTQPIIGRAHIEASGARPGGDRIKIAGIQAKNMLFTGDYKTFNELIRVIENEIKYVEWIGGKFGYTYRDHGGSFTNWSQAGRGIQYSNSFHHRVDGVINTLDYGTGYASSFVEWAVYTANTEYSFSQDKIEHLIDYYLDGICKTTAFGKFPDPGARNRGVSRPGSLRSSNAKIAEDLLKVSDYRMKELQEITDIHNKGIKPTLSHSTFFWSTEYFSYQRPEWFTSVRMYSTRNYNMEAAHNSEGLLNHHRGDGANHISRTGFEYYDIFPVFDYQKVPGTTIMQKEDLPPPNQIQKLGETDFVGAVTDGTYGAVAFDFKSPHDPLVARKSWFFFDDEYVCLGAGISCKQQLPVVTTINQCLLQGDVVLSSVNQRSILAKGEKVYEDVNWILHDGIGYVFPESTEVVLMNNSETGSWWNINNRSSTNKEEVIKDVFKLWIDHGKRPSDEIYQYIVVPSTSIDEMSQNDAAENIDVLVNSPYIQAVSHKGIGMLQAVFYKGGELNMGNNLVLSLDNPGIVILKMENGTISEISVSDPNRELTRFNMFVSDKIEGIGENWYAVWNDAKEMSHISIELPTGNYAGDSETITLIERVNPSP